MSVHAILKAKGSEVSTIGQDQTIAECVSLLNKERIGALVVVGAGGGVTGVISERDILRVCDENKFSVQSLRVRDVMTPKARLITASDSDSIEGLMEKMTSGRVRHLPIMEGDRLIGLVSIGDVVKALLDSVERENQDLRDYISGRYVSR